MAFGLFGVLILVKLREKHYCALCNTSFPDLWDHYWDQHPLFAESTVGLWEHKKV